jgi:hypothetical protein
MTQPVYTAKRKALLASCVTARKCHLERVQRRLQVELADIRLTQAMEV